MQEHKRLYLGRCKAAHAAPAAHNTAGIHPWRRLWERLRLKRRTRATPLQPPAILHTTHTERCLPELTKIGLHRRCALLKTGANPLWNSDYMQIGSRCVWLWMNNGLNMMSRTCTLGLVAASGASAALVSAGGGSGGLAASAVAAAGSMAATTRSHSCDSSGLTSLTAGTCTARITAVIKASTYH